MTGGAGFIGSYFIRFCVLRHPTDEVVNFDLETYARDRTSLDDVHAAHPGRHRFAHGDIAAAPVVADIFAAERPEIVVNFAAESHNSRAALDPGVFVRTNVLGTQVLIEEARRASIEHFHHISICEV